MPEIFPAGLEGAIDYGLSDELYYPSIMFEGDNKLAQVTARGSYVWATWGCVGTFNAAELLLFKNFWKSMKGRVTEFTFYAVEPNELYSGLSCGTGYVTGAFTGVSNAADAVITVANTFSAIADDVYIYIPATGQPGCVVDSGVGGTGTLAAALNGLLHKITEFTSAASFKIATSTAGLDTWVSGGTAALCTFVVPAKSITAYTIYDAGVAKTVTTHYAITANAGPTEESIVQCTTSWVPANGVAITADFAGMLRHDYGRFVGERYKKTYRLPGWTTVVWTMLGREPA